MEKEKQPIMFSAQNRLAILERMEAERLDLLVVGGGITGAGIALDASSRGMKVGLVDMQDFAAGTSSRSTKLVHGGLRYLKQLEIGVVAEVGKERAIVYENGPHITTPEWMLLPLYKGGTFGKLSTSIGLRVYDFLAGVKRGERRKMLSGAETLAKEPLLKRNGLKGGGYYVEYRTDDARLTIETMKKAAEYGALAVNYAEVREWLKDDGGKLQGALIQDAASGREFRIYAAKVVNATGPWVDDMRELDGSKKGKTLRLTKGVHLVFDGRRFPLRQAVYFDTPDGRMVFAIPREGKTYFGTTDTNFKGDTASPTMSAEDRTYLLRAANHMFPGLGLKAEDVESSWAGLRPLIQQEGKAPSEVSRRDEIFVSPSGLVSIAGGKLTGYRKMAESVVNRVASLLKKEGHPGRFGECRTESIPLSGGEVGGAASFETYAVQKAENGQKLGFGREAALELARRYGANVDAIFAYEPEVREWVQRHRLPLPWAVQLRYAMDREMAATPADFLIRRTGSLFFRMEEAKRWKGAVIAIMAEQLGWSKDERIRHEEELERRLLEAVKPVEA
ncbi:glycerol-3-phosphate dehydrogenase/oxidase [Paenibacillus sp. GCM10027627]|uniref:glycerol-3-phosphate dehydrogenase/oxidase n=1 Tax=unclassified Paenibacillus TaxID=185978 RepID=UPI003625AB21